MIANPSPILTIEEYFAWEQQQEIRYEYLEGELIAMTGGTIPHNDIALNLYRALYSHVRSKAVEPMWQMSKCVSRPPLISILIWL